MENMKKNVLFTYAFGGQNIVWPLLSSSWGVMARLPPPPGSALG